MSANIPPRSSVNLTPDQQKVLGEKLDEMGVHIDPKELKTMTMDQLQKRLLAAGKPEAFEKVKSVMRAFGAEGSIQSIPKDSAGMIDKLTPQTVSKLEDLFNQQFHKEGPIKFQQFVQQLIQEHPDGNIPTGHELKKELEEYLKKNHVPQVEAEQLADNVISGEGEGGMGSTSSGGTETE